MGDENKANSTRITSKSMKLAQCRDHNSRNTVKAQKKK